MRYFCNTDLMKFARAEVGNKTQKEWARAHGVSESYLSDFLNGQIDAGPLILEVLGFNPRPFYKRKVEK